MFYGVGGVEKVSYPASEISPFWISIDIVGNLVFEPIILIGPQCVKCDLGGKIKTKKEKPMI